ncbi:hypothetical protein QBC38DRAFT_377429 [Podospora fimiseda]|uniref:Uncharacterized protein n=1 Tax=Podospora fimiseda TaxID=252190 RepID=A0AAN6YL33_9PEZI|nr:hypothetical protein QBC38DRAFT_377429 [Podospora fimiseda]
MIQQELLERDIKNDAELARWMEEVETRKQESGLAVILATKYEQDPGKHHNPCHLLYLPFSREGFDQILTKFPLHGDTCRVINRSDFGFFEDINLTGRVGNSIYYCCRTSGVTAGDLAVSAVFNPVTGFTSAVVFGCSPGTDGPGRPPDNAVEEFAGRIFNSEDAWTHPMLIIGILVEIEKLRHFKDVEKHVFDLLLQVKAMTKTATISSTSELAQENYSVENWISVSRLRIALESWKVQLTKMHDHISELEREYLTEAEDCSSPQSTGRGSFSSTSTAVPDEKSWKQSAQETGRRIQKRLTEIMAEYDEKIRECSMVIDGMALSAQLSWNQIGYQDTQANLKISNATRQDSNQMRSIAFLTMFFLPATFLASLFSMTFFDWKAEPGQHIVSPYFWIYPVLALGITLVVLGLWYFFTRVRPKIALGKGKKGDEEMGEKRG